jgi:hypothetical protein
MAEQILEKYNALPATLLPDRVLFVKGPSDTKTKIFVTTTTSPVAAIPIAYVSDEELTLLLANKQDKFTGTTGQYVRGDGSLAILNKAAVGLSNVDNTSDANKPVSAATLTALNAKANDADVVKVINNQNVDGIKSFLKSPVVPNATLASQAAAYGQVTSGDAALQTQINNLSTTINSAMKPPIGLDCSTNPNYPAGQPGDQWKVTAAGKIGGSAGPNVESGDVIACQIASPGGTHAAVGANYYITQTNIDQATESVQGFAKVATNAKVIAGADDQDFVTSLKLTQKLNASAVRFDAAQSLSGAQQAQARTNIGALGAADLSAYATISGSDAKYVRFDAAQALSGAQQTQARANIGAIGSADVYASVSLNPNNGAAVSLVTNLDVNTISKASRYYATVATNLPANKTFGFVDTTPYAADFFQTFVNQAVDDEYYYRSRNGATYRPWRQVASREHVDAVYAKKATTLSGYGITDAYTKVEVNTLVNSKNQWGATEW